MSAVELKMKAPVAHIVMTRGDTGNRMDQETLQALLDAITSAQQAGCRALLLRSRGADFCLGMNMENKLQDPSEAKRLVAVLDLLHQSPMVSVAYVRGRAQGGGVGLAAACDLVIADKDASFMLPELCWGFIPAVIMPTLLRRLTPAKATSLSLSLRSLPVPEAAMAGLVDEVGDKTAVLRQLKQILRLRPQTVQVFKSYLPRLQGATPEQQAAIALEIYAASVSIEEVSNAARDLEVEGLAPPWFAKYPQSEADNDI